MEESYIIRVYLLVGWFCIHCGKIMDRTNFIEFNLNQISARSPEALICQIMPNHRFAKPVPGQAVPNKSILS